MVDGSRTLSGLDPEQLRAVTAPPGPLRVLAGPGSGKTRVLTNRIAYRASTGTLQPGHVLALTFTREAASEMRTRLGSLGLPPTPIVGTFHAVALAALQRVARDQRRTDPQLIGSRDRLLAEIRPELDAPTRSACLVEIDRAAACDLDETSLDDLAWPKVDPELLAEVWRSYREAKRHRRVLDFDDLLAEWTRLLDGESAYARAQRWRFRHVHVDEAQDLTRRQFHLLSSLLGPDSDGPGPDLFVVGDPNQAIYRFAGADPAILLELHDTVAGLTTVELVGNHRCAEPIGAASAEVIADRVAIVDDDVVTAAPGRDPEAEVAAVAEGLLRCRSEGLGWHQMAVLGRTNDLVDSIAAGLTARGIPCTRPGRAGLMEHERIRAEVDVLARSDSVAAGLKDLRARASRALEPDERALLEDLAGVVEEFLVWSDEVSPHRLRAWLRLSQPRRTNQDHVSLLSFHAAKGREWPFVALVGLEEGLVPHGLTLDDDVVDERRLLYVAMTRASVRLLLSWSEMRPLAGEMHRQVRCRWMPRGNADLTATADTGEAWREDLERQRRALGPGADSARLVDSLDDWRRAQAHRARIRPELVLTDAMVRSIAEAHPADLDELARVTGWGPAQLRALGPSVLEVVSGQSTSSSTTGA